MTEFVAKRVDHVAADERAREFDDDVARYLAAGADGVLKKPIEIAALQSVIMGAMAVDA